jgi:molybdenum cofactor cytidylyltransferase
MKPGAVVPAAGRSRRMGREKILLPFGDSTILGTVLSKLSQIGVTRTVVVVRADLEEAHRIGRTAGAEIVINPDPDDEMLASIRLGVEALQGTVDAFFVWPADHPAVSPATLRELANRARRDIAVIPVHSGKRGHPAIVGAGLVADIARIPPSAGLRQLWRDRADRVLEIEIDDPGILENLDDPETYERVLRQAEKELRRKRGGDFAGKSE